MKLKEYRLKYGYKQIDIAKLLNKTKSSYGYYESGRNEPDIKSLIKLADLFHISIDELVGREHNNFIDKGLLSDTELKVIDILHNLTPRNQDKAEAYLTALLQSQTETT